MNEVQKLLEGLRLVSEMMSEDVIKNATNEELLEYNNLINKIKARIVSKI